MKGNRIQSLYLLNSAQRFLLLLLQLKVFPISNLHRLYCQGNGFSQLRLISMLETVITNWWHIADSICFLYLSYYWLYDLIYANQINQLYGNSLLLTVCILLALEFKEGNSQSILKNSCWNYISDLESLSWEYGRIHRYRHSKKQKEEHPPRTYFHSKEKAVAWQHWEFSSL